MWKRFPFTLALGVSWLCVPASSGQQVQANQSIGEPHAPARPAESVVKSTDSPVTVTVNVDGNVNPELIPDAVAFLHFFRVLARDPGVDQALDYRRRLAYVEYFFRRGCGARLSEDRSLNEGQVQGLLNVAEQLAEQLAAIDSPPPVNGGAEVESAQRQREQIVKDAVNSLDLSVDPDGAAKIRRHVTEHVKRRIQLVHVTMPMPASAIEVQHHGQ